MCDTKEELRRHCEYVARKLEQFRDSSLVYCAEDNEFYDRETYEGDDDGLAGYLMDGVYDIKLTVDLEGVLYGCKLMVAGGGPNIYVNTNTCEVDGYWGCDEIHIPFSREVARMIDDEIEQFRGN